MIKYWVVLSAVLLAGCATIDPDYHFGEVLNRRVTKPRTCLMQAKIYKWYLGGDAKVMSNKTHAFVVMDNKIYDSTNMQYTGRSVDNIYVKCVYGDKKEWKELK